MRKNKNIKSKAGVILILSILLATIILSGCTQSLPSDAVCEQKIKQETKTDYVVLGEWEKGFLSSKREFTAYSYDPTLPENENIYGGWCSVFIDSNGDVTVTFRS